MARLENLRGFDRELNAAFDQLEAFDRKRMLYRGTWSEKQEEQFVVLRSVVGRLANAVSELAAQNR
jgi:hypothetical protein